VVLSFFPPTFPSLSKHPDHSQNFRNSILVDVRNLNREVLSLEPVFGNPSTLSRPCPRSNCLVIFPSSYCDRASFEIISEILAQKRQYPECEESTASQQKSRSHLRLFSMSPLQLILPLPPRVSPLLNTLPPVHRFSFLLEIALKDCCLGRETHL